MPKRSKPPLLQIGSALALVLVLAGCTKGGQFDPTEMLNSDAFDTKKKLKGDRELVFPNGVPGTTTGVPADLVKGYQPPPDQSNADADAAAAPPAQAAAAKPEAKSKPKPKPAVAVARLPKRNTAGVGAPPPSTPTRHRTSARRAPLRNSPHKRPGRRRRQPRRRSRGGNSPGRLRRQRRRSSRRHSRRNRSGQILRRPAPRLNSPASIARGAMSTRPRVGPRRPAAARLG